MAYTTINKSSEHFNTKLYTGNGSTNAITGVGFQPDFVWTKNRTENSDNRLFDAIRGTTYILTSNNTDTSSSSADTLTSFDTDGFTLGSSFRVNKNTNNFASWNWKANGAGSANTAGSINTTSTSVNTTAGFSISKYTGNGTGGATIGHGLGVVPKFAIFKRTNSSGNWQVYHHSIGNTHVLKLNGNDAKLDDNTFLNDTSPSNSLITLGAGGLVNGNGDTHICYAFADVQGFSKFSSYVGNGNADGTFIYTGFKPAFVMVKRTDSADGWFFLDDKRDIDNAANHWLMADSSGAEQTSPIFFDFLSNGFKHRGTGGGNNGSGGTYIYMAFAKAPLVGTNGVTAKAR